LDWGTRTQRCPWTLPLMELAKNLSGKAFRFGIFWGWNASRTAL
jgi:hypothetical protein